VSNAQYADDTFAVGCHQLSWQTFIANWWCHTRTEIVAKEPNYFLGSLARWCRDSRVGVCVWRV